MGIWDPKNDKNMVEKYIYPFNLFICFNAMTI